MDFLALYNPKTISESDGCVPSWRSITFISTLMGGRTLIGGRILKHKVNLNTNRGEDRKRGSERGGEGSHGLEYAKG